MMDSATAHSSSAIRRMSISCTGDCGAHIPGAATGDWLPPFQQRCALTSPFGRRFHPICRFHPIYKEWRLHTGQDLSSLPSAGPVVATAAGSVISAHLEPVYGNIVPCVMGMVLSPATGTSPVLTPKSSQELAWPSGSGSVSRLTGTSTRLHVHFQVEVNGTPVNPVRFMADRGAPLDGKARCTVKESSIASFARPHRAGSGRAVWGFPLVNYLPVAPRQTRLRQPAAVVTARGLG